MANNLAALGTALPPAINTLRGMQQEWRKEDEQARDLAFRKEQFGAEQAYRGKLLGHQEAQLKQAKDLADREWGVKEYNLKKQKELDERLDSLMDITTHPLFLALSQGGQQRSFDYMESGGYTKNGIGKRRDVLEALGKIEGDPDKFQQFMWPETEAKKANVLELRQKAMKAGTPEAKQKITEEANAAEEAYQGSLKGYSQHLERLQMKKIEIEKTLAVEKARQIRDEKRQGEITDRLIKGIKQKGIETRQNEQLKLDQMKQKAVLGLQGKVGGRMEQVIQKVADGTSLTPGEQEIYDRADKLTAGGITNAFKSAQGLAAAMGNPDIAETLFYNNLTMLNLQKKGAKSQTHVPLKVFIPLYLDANPGRKEKDAINFYNQSYEYIPQSLSGRSGR